MDEYFKFKFWKEIISIGLVALLIVSLALTTLFYAGNIIMRNTIQAVKNLKKNII